MLEMSDRAMTPGSEPPLGAHLVSPRRAFTHHGIYVGGGQVVQYGGFTLTLRGGPVEEVTLDAFSQGRPVWIRLHEGAGFSGDEVVRRARQRIGENCYHVLTNNCEHFCEWCVRGEHRSHQVEELLAGRRRLGGRVLGWYLRRVPPRPLPETYAARPNQSMPQFEAFTAAQA